MLCYVPRYLVGTLDLYPVYPENHDITPYKIWGIRGGRDMGWWNSRNSWGSVGPVGWDLMGSTDSLGMVMGVRGTGYGVARYVVEVCVVNLQVFCTCRYCNVMYARMTDCLGGRGEG